jgi:hypothetical protein
MFYFYKYILYYIDTYVLMKGRNNYVYLKIFFIVEFRKFRQYTTVDNKPQLKVESKSYDRNLRLSVDVTKRNVEIQTFK